MKTYQSVVVLFMAAFCTLPLFSQDSLKQILNTNIHDTTKLNIVNQIFSNSIGTNLDSAIVYAKKGVAIAEQLGDTEQRAYMLKNVGIPYFYKGEFVEVLEFWTASLDAFESINDLKGISNLQSNIGAVYNSTGDYSKAIDYHLQALRIADKNQDDFRKATALQNIGAVYSNMEDHLKSREYYERALTLCEEIDYEKCIGVVTMNLSQVSRNLEEYDLAFQQITKAIEVFRSSNDPQLAESMVGASDLFYRQQKYSEAIGESKKALNYATEINNRVAMQQSLTTMGKAYSKLNQIKNAKASFSEALKIGKDIGVNIDMQTIYEGLREVHQLENDFQSMAIVQDSLLSVNKQLYDIDQNDKISNLQLEFDLEKRENEIAIKNQQIEKAELQKNFFTATSLFLVVLIGGVGYLYQFSRKKNRIIHEEKVKSDNLLMNILPPETAEELKRNGIVKPKRYEFTTVLFTDFVGFTKNAADNSPEVIVSSIDFYFKKFDQIVKENNLEKIKTIGDAYMCAGGLHQDDKDQDRTAENTLFAAQQIIHFVQETAANPPEGIVPFQIRIGIDCGPVVAGVVGQTKFQYDIWGDTVNVASRMETNSEPNKINVSHNIYNKLKQRSKFIFRGDLEVKNKGMMKMYYASAS